MKLIKLLIVISLLVITFACKDQNEQEATTNAETETSLKSGELTISDAWVRVAGEGRNTAMFMTIMNGTENDDTLLSAESDAAELVEVHETYKRENDMMGMRQVEMVEIPSQQKVELKPRGLHVMLITLKQDIQIGDTINVMLNFAGKGSVNVTGTAKEMDMKKMNH